MIRRLRVVLSGQRQFGRGTLELMLGRPYVTVVAVSAPALSPDGSAKDRLRDLAEQERLPVIEPGLLNADTLPDCDLIVCAHSHAFIGRRTRLKARVGAIGYHPSLLPLHRGRDAVRWTIRDRDRVAGGSVYWLSDRVDAGPLAAQDYCFVPPDATASTLWRDQLYPMGLRLLGDTLLDIAQGRVIQVPQSEAVATWEPSWERPPLHRPDLFLLGDGRPAGFTVEVDSSCLRGGPAKRPTSATAASRVTDGPKTPPLDYAASPDLCVSNPGAEVDGPPQRIPRPDPTTTVSGNGSSGSASADFAHALPCH